MFAGFPLKVTSFSASVVLKFVPVMVTSVALGPSLGLMLETSGGAALPLSSSSEQDSIKNAHSSNVFATFRSEKEKIVFIIEICFEIKARKIFVFDRKQVFLFEGSKQACHATLINNLFRHRGISLAVSSSEMRFDSGKEDLYHRFMGGKKNFIKINGLPESPGSTRINNPLRFTYLRRRNNP